MEKVFERIMAVLVIILFTGMIGIFVLAFVDVFNCYKKTGYYSCKATVNGGQLRLHLK